MNLAELQNLEYYQLFVAVMNVSHAFRDQETLVDLQGELLFNVNLW